MDAQELPQTLKHHSPSVVNALTERPPISAPALDCTSTTCRQRCALGVLDELLSLPRTTVSGEEVDLLLDLRWQLRQRAEGEGALRLFCDLRRRMEQRHYLAFFRLRRWLENQIVAQVRICPAAEVSAVSVKLDHYCVEAIRRSCLCASLSQGSVMLVPRLQFAFRPLPFPSDAGSAHAARRLLTHSIGR